MILKNQNQGEFMSFSIIKHTNTDSEGNLYIIIDGDNYLIVDPCIPYEAIKKDVQGKTCVGVFLTHAHYDHFCAIDSWLKKGAKIYLAEQAINNLKDIDINGSYIFNKSLKVEIPNEQQNIVGEGSQIQVGKQTGTVVRTAGHTDCSIGLIINGHYFCGDFIFEGGNIGRYDLATGSGQDLRNSLRRLKTFDQDLTIHSGHGADFKLSDYKMTQRQKNCIDL